VIELGNLLISRLFFYRKPAVAHKLRAHCHFIVRGGVSVEGHQPRLAQVIALGQFAIATIPLQCAAETDNIG